MRSRTSLLLIVIVPSVALVTLGCGQPQRVRLTKETYLDKCKGAWAGQMVGVCYGAPYEFRAMGKTIDEPLQPWRPDRVRGAIGQDDCYVEMTWLAALERYDLDITYAEAGQAFGESQYPLWHANKFGRDNVRRGVMPPQSGHPEFNAHADDIDFQIEADLIGILCPGLPGESNRLCDIFGHVMNYGDGVYGGMFVAGMYSAAYFENSDVAAVVEAGLDCIPAESQYHRCIRDVIGWHRRYPDDWRKTWQAIEDRWQDDVDCMPGNPFNIDAKLNGAYIVVGLLYGEGDMIRTMEIATRCGQDSDCNASNAAGVLGCMKGYAALGADIVDGIPGIAEEKFAHTDYGFNALVDACRRMTGKIVQRTGGEVTEDAFIIQRQKPMSPAQLEQWTDQAAVASAAASSRVE